ncbi:hypothetical protein JJB67_15415 [Clostridium perfringens]|uniref:hypothetical protein n=1 Tax=Clostridium perfringens TaxID=1502 RepID=UPI001ABAEDEE|nr:hypothetical protein [Clostridium perfringens]MBO3323738.1 hypothetical protein [Clostridium perfringens]MBO3332822.1 hypothetical protein [Clostridium perfringens]MBO3399390.1 hypothetical protein [Clostridium perfringens]
MFNIINEIKEDYLKEKIEYWFFIWNELIDNYTKTEYGLNFCNIHTLVEEILEEIEFNNLKNSNTNKFFREKLGEYLKYDVIVKKDFEIEISSLIEYLGTDKTKYIEAICRHINEKFFKSKKYLKEAAKILNENLLNDSLDKNCFLNIKYLTQSLIIEFSLLGYDFKFIKNIPYSLFDTYHENEDIISTNLPLPETIKKEDIKIYIENLTLKERLNLINEYIKKENLDVFVIYKLNGFQGTLGLECGDVEFYNPKFKTHINCNDNLAYEFENWDDLKNPNHYYNAIVKVNAICTENAKNEACRKIESVLDTIKCFYNSSEKFSICKDECYILNSEKKFIGGGFSTNFQKNDSWRESDTLISENKYLLEIFREASKFMFKKTFEYNETERKILESLKHFRKGAERDNLEEKLLNYWICIENIVNINKQATENILINKDKETPLKLAQEFLIPVFIRYYINNYYRKVHFSIYNLSQPQYRNSKDSIINYDKKIREKFCLNKNQKNINYKHFLNAIHELNNNTDKVIAKEKIEYMENLYTNNDFCVSELKKKGKEISRNILQIYRYRNMIVHDAHFNVIFLEYYTKLAEIYCQNLLISVITSYCETNNELSDLLLTYHFKFEMLLKYLKKNKERNLKDYIIDNEL